MTVTDCTPTSVLHRCPRCSSRSVGGGECRRCRTLGPGLLQLVRSLWPVGPVALDELAVEVTDRVLVLVAEAETFWTPNLQSEHDYAVDVLLAVAWDGDLEDPVAHVREALDRWPS